jgi:aspartate ammonia-lyase
VAELVLEKGLMDKDALERVLRPEVLTAPRHL